MTKRADCVVEALDVILKKVISRSNIDLETVLYDLQEIQEEVDVFIEAIENDIEKANRGD